MSGYFDALIRSSGMTIGRARPALTPVAPAAIDVDVDGAPAGPEANAMHSASTPHQPLVSPHASDTMELTKPPRVLGLVERATHEEPELAPAPARGATKGAVHSLPKPSRPPVESPTPDLAHTLVRAAMRWVAAGTPQGAADSVADRMSDMAKGVPGRQQSASAQEQIGAITTKGLRRDDDDGKLASRNGAPATPAPLNVPEDDSAKAPVPMRASRVIPAPPLPVPPVRDEVVEVSIGAIHVRVDAPQAQTVARPASTPAASAPHAAASRPSRSALSRRALRRI